MGTLVGGSLLGSPIEFDSGKAVPAEGDWFGVHLAMTGSSLVNATVKNSRYGFYVDAVPASAIT